MKILHIITSLNIGGAEKLVAEIVPLIANKGHVVDVCLFCGANTPLKLKLESSGCKIIELSQNGSVYNPLYIWKLRKLIRKYDIVHTHNTAPQFFAAIASVMLRKKLVTTEHSTSNRRREKGGFKGIDYWLYSRYDRIICISEQAKSSMESYIGKRMNNVVVIKNGIDVSVFQNAIPLKEFEHKDKIYVVMVAGFRYEKDQDTLIKAFSLLPQKFELFLVGDGCRKKELEYYVDEHNLKSRIHFLGIRMDVPQILKSMDIVAMSSHREGLSLSNVEGMAAGKPFIASDVDGLRDVTKGYGILFPHGNYQLLAKELIKLSEDKSYYDKVALKCEERAKLYDITYMVEGYINVYKELMS